MSEYEEPIDPTAATPVTPTLTSLLDNLGSLLFGFEERLNALGLLGGLVCSNSGECSESGVNVSLVIVDGAYHLCVLCSAVGERCMCTIVVLVVSYSILAAIVIVNRRPPRPAPVDGCTDQITGPAWLTAAHPSDRKKRRV